MLEIFTSPESPCCHLDDTSRLAEEGVVGEEEKNEKLNGY